MQKRIDETVSYRAVLRAFRQLAEDMDKISSATIRFDSPGKGGPYWVVIDFLARNWTVWSNQHDLVENRETRVSGEFDTFRDIRDLLLMFSDEHAHERLRALGRAVYGKRSFT